MVALPIQLQGARKKLMSKSKIKKSFKPSNASKKTISASPNLQDVNTLIALFSEGRYAEAAAIAQTMTVRFPFYGFGWKALGSVFKQMGRNADALNPMQKAVALLPNDAEAHNNLGAILTDLGRLDEAVCRYQRALRIKPDLADAYYNLGNTFTNLGRLTEAETNYRRALEIRPDDAKTHYNLGVILQNLNRLNEAEASYSRALQLKPDYADAHYNLGNLLLKQSSFEQAITHYEQALVVAPTLEVAKLALCNSLYSFSRINHDKAKQAASRIKELFHDDQLILRGISGILGQTNISTDETLYTRELFNSFAATFESALNNVSYNTPRELANELGFGSGAVGDRALDILDAGCGTGLCGIYLRPSARTLVGVDLSVEMLRLASEKHIYDALHEDNIINFMQQNKASFDLIVSADVLIYIGDIQELVESIFSALRQNGILAISAECMEPNQSSDTFALHPSGRYQHSINYLKQLLEDAGFSVKKITACILRTEFEVPIAGWIIIAEKL